MQNIISSIKNFWNQSIQRQLVLGIAFVHAILMTIFVSDLVSSQRSFLDKHSIDHTEALAGTLAANSVTWVLSDDVIGLEEILRSQKSHPDIEYAMILSPRGKVLAHTDNSLVGLYVQDTVSLTLLNGKPVIQHLVNDRNLLDIGAPIFSDNQHIGWSRVAVSQKTVNSGLRKILYDGLGYTLLAIIVGSIFAVFMARGIISGIRQLLKVTHEVEHGRIDAKVIDNRSDELGQLGDSFNKMINKVKQSIDDLETSQQLALEEKEKAQAYLNTAMVAFMVLDLKGDVLLINPHCLNLLDYKEAEVLGKNWFETCIPKQNCKERYEQFKNRLQYWNLEDQQFEAEIITKNKKICIMEWRNTRLYDQNETLIGILSSGIDITEKRKNEDELKIYRHQLEDLVTKRTKELEKVNNSLEQEIIISKTTELSLRESEVRYRTVADFTYEWEYWVGKNGQYIYVSPSCKRISGYGPDDFINDPDFMMEIIHPDDRAKMHQHKHDVEKSGTVPVSFRIISKDGNERWIAQVCQGMYTTEGKFLGRRGSNRDITEQKKLQEEILKSRKLEALGALAGGIAHDFNNLLYIVMGNISLVQDDVKSEPEIVENLKAAEEACVKAKELSARLITFSSGGDPVKKPMFIDDLLKEVVVSTLKGFNVKSEVFVTDAARQVNIDEFQIKQVFRNITVNARESMGDSGRLTILSENVNVSEKGYMALTQGVYIKISFKDQGCGIAKENLDKIFDPYFTTKDMGINKGQGLGLSASYSIIEKHGGLITVESVQEMGSTFSVYLPTGSDKKIDSSKLEEEPVARISKKRSSMGKGKILLMDDEEKIRIFLGQLISRLGYDVETCTEGKETIDRYREAMELKEPFDMIIVDLTNKVGMGGKETMERVLEIDQNAKGIVITGYSNDPVASDFKSHGFLGLITKPATRDELSKILDDVIQL
ncbi:PAS domain S-box protein [bacterium]|nr:PAS domain S-box protein [bacterium]